MGTLKLGQLLITRGLLHPDHLSAALAEQQEVGARLGMILVRRGFVDEETLIRTLAGQLKLPVARIRGKRVGPEVIEFVPVELAEKHRCLPLFFKQEGAGRVLFVAMEDPSDAEALAEISRASGHDVRAVLVGPTELEEAIQRHYHWTAMTGESPEWSPAAPRGGSDGETPSEAEAPTREDEVEPLGADPVGELDPLSAPDADLEPDFDTNWRADADAESEAIAAADPWTGELGGAVTTPDLGGDELDADFDADLGADLDAEPGAEAADAESDLDFDPQFQLDLPELPRAPIAALRPESLDPGIILRALSQLLVEKGVISREEFVERLSQLAAREGAE